jgi:serine/threonine-protein kinase
MIGARLGPYEVLSKLGAGGMGEVYRARDTKLNRDVALKVLPDSFASDPDRLARFTREAQTLASLNQPQIAAIYGIEDSGGVRALVMELVEGEDLSQRLARGAIPLDEALPIAKQIAEALEAAHEQGIIHRDLKPANVKVRDDGTVKVLDFGLAKAMDPTAGAASSASMSPTLSLHATAAGMILGTAAYMAPEQAKGKSVDRRADVWAFGAVLYEMLTGKRAFAGEDISDVLVSVLRDEADMAALPAEVPERVRQVLRVCLQKDPKKRVRDMSAIRLALDGAFDAPSAIAPSAPTPVPRATWRRALPWVVIAILLGALATGGALWPRRGPVPRVAIFTIPWTADQPFRVPLQATGIALSPDGSRLVYRVVQDVSATDATLFQRELGQLSAVPIPGTEGTVGGFFFSPDGRWIAFHSDGALKRISVAGGVAQTICPVEGSFRGGSWGRDDTIVYASSTTKGLRRVRASGGEPEVLTKIDPAKNEADHFWPEILPDGKGVLFTVWNVTTERSRIAVLSLVTGTISDVVQGGSLPKLAPSGHLVYYVGGTLRAVQFDPVTRQATGDPIHVLDKVAGTATGAGQFAIANDGSLFYVRGSASVVPPRTLVWVDRKGRQDAIKAPARAYTYARLSPDDTRIALDARDQQNDIWIWDLARETLQRLTTDPGLNRMPVWTPDSQRVAFTVERDGTEVIYWQQADGSGAPERLSVGSATQGPASFSPDGKRLVFDTPLTAPFDIGLLTLDGKRHEEMLIKTKFSEGNGMVSRDGQWLAYESTESGRSEVYLAPFPNVAAQKIPVSNGGGTRPLWSKDGRELFYYVTPDTIMSVPVTLGPQPVLGKPVVVVKGPYAVALNSGRHYDVSRDGQRFLLLVDAPAADGQKPEAPELRFVQNWTEELKAKVPAAK